MTQEIMNTTSAWVICSFQIKIQPLASPDDDIEDFIIHLVFSLSYWTNRECGKWFSGLEPHDQRPSLHSAQVHTFYFGRYTWFPEEVKYAAKWRIWLLNKQEERKSTVIDTWKDFPLSLIVVFFVVPTHISVFMPIMVVSWNFSYT